MKKTYLKWRDNMIVPSGTKEDSPFLTDHWEVNYDLCNTI
jgi:hypothetical protein